MNDLGLIERHSVEGHDCKIKKLKSLPVLSYFTFCNVLYIYIYGRVRAIPTYRVYRLYGLFQCQGENNNNHHSIIVKCYCTCSIPYK